MTTYRWDRETLAPRYDVAYEGTGTRLTLVGPHARLATIVRYPGTLWRVYWQGGATSDFRTETEAVQAVEARFDI